jgi:hypothetical protein
VVIVPIYKQEEQRTALSEKADSIVARLKSRGISVKYDNNDNKKPGWKFAEYELKGVPVRIAIGPRDRIGVGPWYSAKGVLVANNVAELHGDIERDRNQLNKVTALNEKGETVNGVGDAPNQHDMLTGSDSHGRAVSGTTDTTCSNWTSNASAPGRGQAEPGAPNPGANLGHHDRTGGGNTSWNFAHRSSGCSQANLVATGGAGLFYCFAAN